MKILLLQDEIYLPSYGGGIKANRRLLEGLAEKQAGGYDYTAVDYRKTFANPFLAAQRGYIDDVIFPRTTRQRLIRSLQFLESKRTARPNRKHGNIPL